MLGPHRSPRERTRINQDSADRRLPVFPTRFEPARKGFRQNDVLRILQSDVHVDRSFDPNSIEPNFVFKDFDGFYVRV